MASVAGLRAAATIQSELGAFLGRESICAEDRRRGRAGQPGTRCRHIDDVLSPDTQQLPNVNAAVRLKDGVTVWLKHCSDRDDQETGIYLYFASEPRRSDPRNRCCPLLDILRAPSTNGRRNCILVVPLLRAVDTGDPDPETVKDMLDGILQLAEVRSFTGATERTVSRSAQGLEFLHEHNVAHRCVTCS